MTALTTRLPHRHWPAAYRPLRPTSLLVQAAVLVLAEVVLFRAYGAFDSAFHWGAHFLVAICLSAVVLSGYLLLAGIPAPGQLLTVLGFHLYAMSPDLLFRWGIPHAPWMNVFAGHIAVHYLPGGDRSWLAVAVLAVTGYVLLLACWLSARDREAAAGMTPGIGLGGSAVWRAQADPRTTLLAHTRQGDSSPSVVLLHGLGGTQALWQPVAELLAADGVPSVRVDLLGFGASLGTGTRFTPHDQAEALARLLDVQARQQFSVVAHSYAALVAVALAHARPDLVRQLVLVTPPVFPDPEQARARVGARSWLARATLQDRWAAHAACGLMCLLRRPLRRAAPRFAHLPTTLADQVAADVARGGVAHSYPAYRQGLLAMFDHNPLAAELAQPALPLTLVVAQQDQTAPAQDLVGLPVSTAVQVHHLPGGHLLPLTHPDQVQRLILACHGTPAA